MQNIWPGRTAERVKALHIRMKSSHRVWIEAYILDQNHNYLHNITHRLVGGGPVDIDADAVVTRSVPLEILDPNNELDLNDNADGQKFYNRQLQLLYHIDPMNDVDGPGDSFYIFTGPITHASRSGPVIEVEASSKEAFCSDGGLRADYTWPAGWPKAHVIVNALQIFAGENLFDIQVNYDPNSMGPSEKLGENWTVGKSENLFEKLRALAGTMNCRLFYTANGYLTIRPIDTTPRWTFSTDWLSSEPTVDFDSAGIRNTIVALGAGGTDGESTQATATVITPPEHPYSPQSLARGGQPRYLVEFLEDEQMRSNDQCYERAVVRLNEALTRTLDIGFNAPIIPYFEEWDVYIVDHPKFHGVGSFIKASIPLFGDAEMSVGFMSNTSQGTYSVSNFFKKGTLGPNAFKNDMPKGPKPKYAKLKKSKEKSKAKGKASSSGSSSKKTQGKKKKKKG